jgi:hypothetical protein
LKRASIAAVAMAALAAALLVAWNVPYFSPAAATWLGLGTGNPDTAQSFTFGSYTIQLAGAYADSQVTVINLKGGPPDSGFGRTYLTDQFGTRYEGVGGEGSSTGDMALSFQPASWLASLTGMGYTLSVEQGSDVTVTRVSTLKGVVLLNTATKLQTPASDSFGNGRVTFFEARYGARVVAVRFEVRGVTVIGGYRPSEAAVTQTPSIQVQLAPLAGGAAKNMFYRSSVSGDVTQIYAIATLVDPGTYSVILSLQGVATLQRTLVVG